MTHLTSGALTAALLCSLQFGVTSVDAARAAGNQAAPAPLVLARTDCDDNGRCYETGDRDRGFDQDNGDGGVRRRRDPDDDNSPPRPNRRDFDRDNDPPPPRERRRFDDPDNSDPPARDFDRRPPSSREFRDRRRDDDE